LRELRKGAKLAVNPQSSLYQLPQLEKGLGMATSQNLVERFALWIFRLFGWDVTLSDLHAMRAEMVGQSWFLASARILRRQLSATRLERALTELSEEKMTTVDLSKLYRMVGSPSQSWFVEQLQKSPAKKAFIETSFRVISPDDPMIYVDFHSFSEIPEVVHDTKSGVSFKPDFNLIKVVAKVFASGALYARP